MRSHSGVLPEGAVLVADQQTRGKGRGGNVWTSPDGCLMFTALRRLQVQQDYITNYITNYITLHYKLWSCLYVLIPGVVLSISVHTCI